MLILTAEDGDGVRRWERTLVPGREYVVGRDAEADLPTPWDPHVSRGHAVVRAEAGGVDARLLPGATNPLWCRGAEGDAALVRPGEHFVLGSTSFRVAAASAAQPAARQRVEELTFDRRQLEQVRYRDPDRRIDVLSHLPEVIWSVRSDDEFDPHLVNLVLAGVSQADAVAIATLDASRETRVRHWGRRRETAGEFRPSVRLLRDALARRSGTVLHVWDSTGPGDGAYTQSAGLDWAFCTPVPAAGEPWALYVAGRLTLTDDLSPDAARQALQADVKFTELVAEIVSSVQRLRRLERQQSGLRQFFAAPVLAALGPDLDLDLLEPRECDVTALFCDLRGFSRKAEQQAGNLLALLDRVSRALGVMTEHIRGHGGVTADFQGDSTLGFWGWPVTSGEPVLDACRAALGIRRAFRRTFGLEDHPLGDFEVGIGIAHGRGVAGKIGTSDQVKVTVFGPVVNLAQRLEGMTKHLHVPILLDEATAAAARAGLSRDEGRVRRLARVLPYGMETALVVSELLPPPSELPDLSDEHVAEYETAVDDFTAGRWDAAYRSLHQMPAADRAQDFLNGLITRHNRTPPPDWNGTVRLPGK